MTDTRISSWPTQQVISAAQKGDACAIATLLSGSHVHVRRFARTLCSTPEDAEDAAQEALIVLYRRIGTLRASAALASWVFQIVRNECIRRARVGIRRHTMSRAVEPSAEDTAIARMELERIVECISSLPPEQRAVLVLRDIQGLSGAATAELLGLSRAAMKSRLHRGREALRDRLKAPGDRLKAPGDRLKAPGDRLKAPGDRLTAPAHSSEAVTSREIASRPTASHGGTRDA